MTLRETPSGLLITHLPWEELALLAHALPLTPSVRQVLTALLEGRRVAVAEDAFAYKAYRRTAPPGIYRTFISMERRVREMGLVRVKGGSQYDAWHRP